MHACLISYQNKSMSKALHRCFVTCAIIKNNHTSFRRIHSGAVTKPFHSVSLFHSTWWYMFRKEEGNENRSFHHSPVSPVWTWIVYYHPHPGSSFCLSLSSQFFRWSLIHWYSCPFKHFWFSLWSVVGFYALKSANQATSFGQYGRHC